ncbi:hypothetical protein [Actinoplanes auranticolor]|uniref:WD40 repeat protein n=1 Tax=Actinoplanes auranticolor TaxID=47988 RepID=A0A919VVS0_9ACTN|nr:hypothetical protein [Actinoplanes auranticolor]GIM76960.1 hypothetical protein Aau02nite_73520 [Actinoplanes auranticolor]
MDPNAETRRRRRWIGLSAVLLLAAGVGVPVSVVQLRDPVADPVAELPAGPAGPRLVTAYAADQKWYVIDPAAGRYRQVDGGGVASVSPDLRLYTDVATQDGRTSLVRITPTSGAGPDEYHEIAGDAAIPVWSPDGSRLALPVFGNPADGLKTAHGFTELILVDVGAGTMQRRKIEIGDRYGRWVSWAGDDTLLVGTDGAGAEEEAGVAVVRRDGRMLSWRPLPAGDPCEAPPRTAPPSHGGKVLSCTQDGSDQIYRVFDPRRGTTGPELGRLPLSPDRRAEPLFWQGDDALVLRLFDLAGDGDFADVRVARLSTGQIEAAPRGLPEAPVQASVGSSAGLSAAGAKLTF